MPIGSAHTVLATIAILDSGVDPREGLGWYIPSNIWQGGWPMKSSPPHYEKLTKFCLIFTKIQTKSTDFALKTADFWCLMILAKFIKYFFQNESFGQSGPKNFFFFYQSPALSFRLKYSPNCTIPVAKIQNFPASQGGTSPLDTPLCAQARNWRWRATKSSPIIIIIIVTILIIIIKTSAKNCIERLHEEIKILRDCLWSWGRVSCCWE